MRPACSQDCVGSLVLTRISEALYDDSIATNISMIHKGVEA